MTGASGIIVILPSRPDGKPLWLKAVEGQIVSRSEAAALAGIEAEGGEAPRTMIVLPASYATIRRVDVDPAMPAAQARSVALRKAHDASLTDAAELHAVPCVVSEGMTAGMINVAVIARSDMAHFIAWARHQGLDADVILPAQVLLPDPAEGFVAAMIGDADLVRGGGIAADASEPWLAPLLEDKPITRMQTDEVEASLLAALAEPPVNLRAGEFARPRGTAFTMATAGRLAIWGGFIALATLLISLALIAKYHWSAASLDERTVEIARPLLPAANDAQLVAEEIDRMVAAKSSSGSAFTGPVAGLMTAMQGVPAVSLTSLALGDDGLVHATLASARAEDINTVLLAVQAAGYSITATSSADSGGRVLAEITVQP